MATALQWTVENPAAGQCNVTALLVHELFGGELLKTRLPQGDHFYNRIDGQRYDFTDSQFSGAIFYSDLQTTRSEVEHGATNAELAALRAAFKWPAEKATARRVAKAFAAKIGMAVGIATPPALLHPWGQIFDSPLEREVIAVTHDDFHVADVAVDKRGA